MAESQNIVKLGCFFDGESARVATFNFKKKLIEYIKDSDLSELIGPLDESMFSQLWEEVGVSIFTDSDCYEQFNSNSNIFWNKENDVVFVEHNGRKVELPKELILDWELIIDWELDPDQVLKEWEM